MLGKTKDHEAVKSYVMGADHLRYTQLADGTVQVNVTHSNLKQLVQDLRLDLHMSIAEVKRKLYTHNGSSISHMELVLKDNVGNVICRMLDDDRPLGYYSVQNGMEIHVLDTDPFSLSRDGGLDDVSKVEKYRMSEEDYDKRDNTYRAWKRNALANGVEVKPLMNFKPQPPASIEEFNDPSSVEHITVGSRCSISPGDRRGVVQFVGLVPELQPGYWVGVLLDEPLGKNNGTVKSKKYFDAPENHGSFVRPNLVVCGDFKESWEEELDNEL